MSRDQEQAVIDSLDGVARDIQAAIDKLANIHNFAVYLGGPVGAAAAAFKSHERLDGAMRHLGQFQQKVDDGEFLVNEEEG